MRNSVRLKTIIRRLAEEHGWNWRIELVQYPDNVLAGSKEVVAAADSAVLDRCEQWHNLSREIVDWRLPWATVVPMADAGSL